MKKAKLIKYLCIVNLLIIFLLVLDTFILPTVKIPEVFESSTHLETRGKTSGYSTYQVTAKSGNKYQFPDDGSIALDYDSHFLIEKSGLFRLPMVIAFQYQEEYYRGSISFLKTNYIVQGIILMVLGFSVFGLVSRQPSENAKRNVITVSIFLYGGLLYLLYHHMQTGG